MTDYNGSGWDSTNGYDNQPSDAFIRRSLRSDANFVGIVTLTQTALLQVAFIVLLFVLAAIGIAKPDAGKYYGLGNTGFLLIYSVAYAIGMGLPAPVVAAIARRHIRPFARFDSDHDENHLQFPGTVLVPLAGLSVCVLANFVTTYIVYLFSLLGLYPPDMPAYMEKTALSLVLNVIIFAVMPAIFEEMVYRGYILRTLRSYGDGVAIVISSLLFALMHGNILQIPFAFLVGATCAIIVLRTGHIWLGMLLHFLNNFMSVLLQYTDLFAAGSTERSQQITMMVFSLIGMLGLVAFLILYALSDPIVRRPDARTHPLPAGKRTTALALAPAMIVSVVVSLVLTAMTTKWGGA